MDSTLYVLKVAGLAIAAVLGIFGTIHDYRDKTSGRLTRWGKLAICGVALSAGVAIVAQVLEETLKQRSIEASAREAASAAARSERVVNELARVLQPLRIDRVFVTFSVPLADPRFSSLREHVDSLVEQIKQRPQAKQIQSLERNGARIGEFHCAVGPTSTAGPSSCVPRSIQLTSKHPFFPSRGIEAAVFRINSITLAIYRTPIDTQQFHPLDIGAPDLFLQFGADGGNPLVLTKAIDSSNYTVSGFLGKDPRGFDLDNSGRIVAVPDLAGSQIFLSPPDFPEGMLDDGGGRTPVTPFQRQFELEGVQLHIGPRMMSIPKEAWHKGGTAKSVYWVCIVPADPFWAHPRGQ
jgi:hypothetical protein